MTLPNLTSLFEELHGLHVTLLDEHTFLALNIPGIERHRIAITSDGLPSLLFATVRDLSNDCVFPIVLEAISVHYGLQCRVVDKEGKVESGLFTIVRCTSKDDILQKYFLKVTSAIIASFQHNIKQSDISLAIKKLIELFSVLTDPSRKSVSGLWGELFFIAQSSEPKSLVSAWHVNPYDLHDFAADIQRIEVKTAANKQRCHHFNLAQLIPSVSCKIVVASLFVEQVSLGVSLGELIDRVKDKVKHSPALITHIDKIVIQTLGNGLKKSLDQSFDYQLASSSLLYFDSREVPSVSFELPSGVFDVHFKSQLDPRNSIDVRELKKELGIFKSMVPDK